MAIDTYSDLALKLPCWLGTEGLGEYFDDWLSQAESTIFSMIETHEQDVTGEFYALKGERYTPLPPSLKEIKSLCIHNVIGYESHIRYVSPSAFRHYGQMGVPQIYTIQGMIEWDVIPDNDYKIACRYSSTLEHITAANQTNFILRRYPNIYVSAIKHYAYDYMEDYQRSEAEYQKMIRAIDLANEDYRRLCYPANLSVRIKGATP